MEAGYTLRPYRASDSNFIQNSWGASYYKGAEFVTFLSPREFNAQHRLVREEILKSPHTVIIVACGKEDEDLILGWILMQKPKGKGVILHYLYVKEAFKGEGVSEELLKLARLQKPVLVTHMTDRARKIIMKKYEHFEDFTYAEDTIMIRDKYLTALPRSNQ